MSRRVRAAVHVAAGVAAVAGIATLAVRRDRAIGTDLTAAALSRRQSVAELAATTVAEKLDRLTDVGVALGARLTPSGAGREIPWPSPASERLSWHA